MESENSHNFDLPALLKLGNLDIRKIARNNPSLRVGEYVKSLSEFTDKAVTFMNSLKRISSQKINDRDVQFIANTKTLLAYVGIENFIPVIDDITNACKRGHIKFAAEYAKKLLDDFDLLYKQIMTAKNPKSVDDVQFQIETQLLSKVLNLLDHEESTRKLRVLTVDDAPSMVKTISAILEDDYMVYGLTDPTMVEKFLKQITPELFLLDYDMPKLSGFELVPVIRDLKEHKDTPIIFLTSLGTIEHVSAAYALGACDFIVKPFQDTVLQEKVAKHIARKKFF